MLGFEFVNASPLPPPEPDGRAQQLPPNIEPFLFDVKAKFTFHQAAVVPFELELAPRGFRYNRDLWGRGFNCALERDQADPFTFTTTHAPIYRQDRLVTREQPRAAFANLAADPTTTLRAVLDAMRDYKHDWEEARNAYRSINPDWEEHFGSVFDADQQLYNAEVERFRRGCQIIFRNADARLAFQLTNETFQRMGNHPLPERRKEFWRLFQLVFLVSQVPGIASLSDSDGPDASEREVVDIIYFPTGGGKTEAYLGALVFHCFFDRLRGKAAGVTAWTRFPLRLLTLQQTQRVADVIGWAEIVRREQTDQRLSGNGVDGFAVGYFVGEGGSPNEITAPTPQRPVNGKEQVIWSRVNDPHARQTWKRVVRCPSVAPQPYK